MRYERKKKRKIKKKKKETEGKKEGTSSVPYRDNSTMKREFLFELQGRTRISSLR